MLFTILGMFLVDKFGRRILLLYGMAGMGVSMALVGFAWKVAL